MSDPEDILEREDRYRDHGIHPDEVPPPEGPVRTSLGPWTVAGQGIGTGGCALVGVGGLVLAGLSWLIPPPGVWIALAVGPLFTLLIGFLIYHVTKNDYLWVDIDGRVVSAKHLYTGRLVVRDVAEVKEVRTLVMPAVVGAMLGRVKGWLITFKDGRAPLQVIRSDPAMKNACLFVEALLHAMRSAGPVEAEEINLNGSPVVMRVYWAGQGGGRPDWRKGLPSAGLGPRKPPDERLRR
jgi:hypothetical protein